MSDIKGNKVTIPLIHFEQFYLIYQITNSMPLTNNLVFKHNPGLTEDSKTKNTQRTNHNPFLGGLLPQPGLCLYRGGLYKSADKFERPELGLFLIVLAKSRLLKHYSPFRNGTEGQFRRNLLIWQNLK